MRCYTQMVTTSLSSHGIVFLCLTKNPSVFGTVRNQQVIEIFRNIIFINPTLTKSCQESLRWMSQSFVLKYYTIFQYFFRILVIPTLPLRALFNYNALLHSNGDHFFEFTWNRLLVPDKKSFGLWYREKPTSYWDFQGSLRVNIIVCLLQKTADITYAVVEQGNSMPRTAPKKPLRTYETEYVITRI